MPEPFDPDWVISPGETLRDWMEENHLSLRVTAGLCLLHVDELEDIVEAREPIDERMALHLAAGTHIPARLWRNLERAYRDGLAAGKTDVSKA